jgi:hypothetical protein
MRLGEPEPVVVAHREVHVGTLEMLDGRHDVEHSELLDPLRMVERQAMRQSRTAIVAADLEALEAERLHHLDHVLRHRPLGVGRMILGRLGLERAAVAAQVGRDHGEALGQRRPDAVPHRMRLWIAVQQQKWRAGTTMAQAHGAAGDGDFGQREILEEHACTPPAILPKDAP